MDDQTVSMLVELATKSATDALKELQKETKNTQKEVKDVGRAISQAFKTTEIIGWAKALNTAIGTLTRLTSAQGTYIENLNLMQVAFDDNTKSVQNLIDKMNNYLGMDQSELTRSVGIYRQMASAMDMNNDVADRLAENLLKMQADISSLYNLDFSTAGTKLQSAMAGLVKLACQKNLSKCWDTLKTLIPKSKNSKYGTMGNQQVILTY